MAESSKKHSRKSKLVPRECIEIDDDVPTSAELEEAVQSIPTSEQSSSSSSILPKIKTTFNEDSFKESSPNPVELCVQVQVESCSDEEQEPNLYHDDDDEKYLQEQLKLLSKLPKKEIILYPDTIRKVVDETANKIKSAVDRQLDLFIRNSLWRYMKTFEPDYYEQLLQDVLSQWRVWTCMSKMRSYILAFKCNICCQGWWHLQPFEEHIRLHKTVTLQLETYHHDCVITAVSGDWYESMCQVYVEGNCPRCLNDFESHMKPIRQTMYYNCKACFERFPTCQRMFNHEGVCVRYGKMVYNNFQKHDERWHCQLCNIECLSGERHLQHFAGCHSVRSDEPITMQNCKDCNQCGLKYMIYNLHVCPKRNDNFKCSYCFRKFQNKFVQDVHENNFNSSCHCPVCNRFIKKHCMLYEHLVRHSKYYVMAYKCQECADCVLVASEPLMATHKCKYHDRRHDRRNFYDTLIVPKQCLSSKLSESVSMQDMILERKKPPKKEASDQETLKTLSKIMQVQQEYEQNCERERRRAQQLALQQEHEKKVVNDISKELANKFLRRANDLQVVAKCDSGTTSAADSPEFDDNDNTDIDNDKTDFDDELNSDDELRIDDDDIGETESSVNALLNQFKIKKDIKEEIDIEEPDLTHYMSFDDSQEGFNVNDNNDNTQMATGVVKNEFLDDETTESDDMFIKSDTVSIKKENIDSPLTVNEESHDSDCILVKIPDIKTNDTKHHEIDLETKIFIKTEPIDSNEMDMGVNTIQIEDNIEVKIPDRQAKHTKQNEIDLETEIVVKTEPIDSNEMDISDNTTRTEDNIKVKIPDRQTKNTKQNEIDLETNIVVKTEPKDSNEINMSENTTQNEDNIKALEKVTPKTEKGKDNLPAEEKRSNEIVIKEEKEDYQELDVTEDDLDKEQKACLEELSKVFQASNSSKQVKLSNLCVDEVKVKAEPMDEDEEFEQDLIVTNDNKGFKVTVHSEPVYSSCSDESTDSVDTSPLEPEVNISESPKTAKTKSVKRKKHNTKVYSCKKCDFAGEHKSYVDHIETSCARKSKNRSYETEWTDLKCSKCNKNITSLRHYLTHLHKSHNLALLTCPLCFKEFPNFSHALLHLKVHIKRNFVKLQILKERSYFSSLTSGVHQCKICNDEVFYKNFFNHWERHLDYKFDDDEEKGLVIDESVGENIGGTSSNDVAELTPDIKQMLAQLELPPGPGEAHKRCCACGRRFERRNDTKRHLIEHLLVSAYEAPGNGLRCQLCGHVSEKAGGYKVHMRQHGSLPVFRCEMCRKCFSDSSNFAKHKKVHNLQALNCDHCKRKFQSKKQLEIHMELHRTTEPIKCGLCERVCPLPSDYRKHMRSTHGGKAGPSYCSICRKREFTKRALWDHMWLAHKIRHNDADCLVCGKSFRKYVDMRAHMRGEHQLNPAVTIKTLRHIRAMREAERVDKIRELLKTTVTLANPSSGETFVIYE